MSRSCARRRRSIRIATPCARASRRSRALDRPRRREGDDQREARRHSAAREGIAAYGDRDDPPPLDRAMIDAQTRALAERVLAACRARKWTVATAESCTGGLVAGALTEIAGSSDVVDRGFVTYSNAAKMAMLGVPEATLAPHGAVSQPDRRGDGERRARARRRRSHRGDHRRCRPGRRHSREAGRARAFRRRPRKMAASPIARSATAISAAAKCAASR